jgi:putative MATE family efflux protein
MAHQRTRPAAPERTRLTGIAAPIFGEFVLGITVAMGGLWLASHEGDIAAGAFGLSQQVLETLSVLFRVMAIGSGIVVTPLLGSGNRELVRHTALTVLSACTWIGLVAAAWLLFAGNFTLNILNAPAEVQPMARSYMMFLAPSMVLEACNLAMASILRAHLQARKSFWVMVVMHSTHLLLAVGLMRGWGSWDGLGIEGFAIAMFLSRALGLVLHLRLWRTGMQLQPTLRDWWYLRWQYLAPVLRIGVPGAASEMFYRINFMVAMATTARLGVVALATSSYTLQTLKYVLLTSMAIGWACEIMVGRLVGARKLREADQLVRKGVRNGMLASGGLVLLAAISAPWLMRVFTRDPEIIHQAQVLLWISVVLELGRVFNLVVIGALRATGDVHFPVKAGLISQAVLLGLGSYVLGRQFGLPGIWMAYVADECVRGWIMWLRWRQFGWLSEARRTVRTMARK